MNNLIQPRILKGFRDFLPNSEIQRTTLTEKITKVYRSFGFVPIDTPVLEYTEILLRKSNGETEKQVFRFEDNGGRDVAMRFDLTVPFARFTAEHKDEIYSIPTLSEDEMKKDYIYWPLPKMDLKTRFKICGDQFAMAKVFKKK